MKRILHILTHPAKPEVEQLILDQQKSPDQEVLVLSLNEENPDYKVVIKR